MHVKFWGAWLIMPAFLLICGCSSEPETYKEVSVEELYNSAMDHLLSDNLELAAIDFDELERQHPYSIWARKSQLMSAYAHYVANNYDEAIFAAKRFLRLHPGNKYAAYAQYLIGISYYEQITDIGRDQSTTQRALDALIAVVERYPNTQYARDSKLKIDLARDHLSAKEMEIGRYYLRRKLFAAAIKRFGHVIEHYQTTTHVPEALHRLTEAYLSLGVSEEAQTAAAILGHNYPGSDWYRHSYALLQKKRLSPEKKKGSWISKIWDSIF